MKYELPQLPYEYNALEPHIDAKTMEIHHSKHHQGYTDKLNAVIEKNSSIADRKVEDLLRDLDNLEIDDADKKALRNNGGGYVNHSLFWEIMGKDKDIDEQLVSEIEATFGSTEKFKEQFTEAATTQFGSGWAWLVKNSEDKLEVYGLPNQDSPYLQGHTPIIGLDVWEHAYYLNYQNRRPDYIDAWWNVLKLI